MRTVSLFVSDLVGILIIAVRYAPSPTLSWMEKGPHKIDELRSLGP